MDDLLIYYNENYNTFVMKKVTFSYIGYRKIGDVNQFNHTLVEIWTSYKNNFITIKEYQERTKGKELVIRNKLIDRIIGLLDKLKK